MSQYVGIADCHGLESFISVPERVLQAELDGENGEYAASSLMAMLSVRAQANRHRHAVIYRAEVGEKEARKIKSYLSKGKYAEALIRLKNVAKKIEVGKQLGMAKSWEMIPNPKLDPFSG